MIQNSGCRSRQVALRLSLNMSSALLVPLLAVAVPAQAQSVSTARAYNIPAQQLGSALREYMRQSGVQVGFPSEIGDNVKASAVTGSFSAPEALSRLLTGTGLTFRFTGANTVTLERAPQAADGAINLGPVRVEGSGGQGSSLANRVNGTALTEGTRSLTTNGPVTAATGLGLTLRETPQSVTVITRERMDQQNLASLTEVVEQTPGIFFNSTGTPMGGRNWIYSRGFTVSSYQIDGVNVPWATMGESEQHGQGTLDTAVYDSVTVVRGATGVLTGAGDPSGSISLTRKKPTRELQASVAATVGSWDRYRFVGDIAGPLTSDGSIRGRIVGAYDESKSWVDRYASNRKIGYGVLEADLSPNTLVTLAVEHNRDNSDGVNWADAYGPTLLFDDGETLVPKSRSVNQAPNFAYSKSNRTTLTAAVEQGLGADWNARLSYFYTTFKSSNRRGMVFGIPADGSPTSARLLMFEVENDVHTIDGKIDGTYTLFGRQNELAAGVNLSFSDQSRPINFVGLQPGLASWQNGQMQYGEPDWAALPKRPSQTNTDQHGAYLATRIRPTDQLSFILAGRVSWWKTRSANLEPFNVWDNRRYSGEFTPYLGAIYDLTSALSAYASYTRIFQPQSSEDVNGRILDPEAGKNYEVVTCSPETPPV